ncbi:hypothetical protein ACFL21_03840 [Patescibacteria group bacterium]
MNKLDKKYSQILENTRIEMVETAKGCPEACLHCGAYENFCPANMKINELNINELEKNILQRISRTPNSLIHYFNTYITTYVNIEPLRTTNFIDFSKLVYQASEGMSRVVAISHGLRGGNKKMRKNLKKIVKLMKDKIIPLFVVTMDFARSKGNISYEQNFESYYQTLSILGEAIDYSRVTVSLQGEQNPNSPLFIGRVQGMFEELIKKLLWENKKFSKLVIDHRAYTKIGRACKELASQESEDCDVIPDPEFVENCVPRNHLYRGMIDFNGNLLIQKNRPGKTYGDSVNQKLWEIIKI